MRLSSRAVEAVCILLVLSTIAFASGNSITDWCSTFAVFLYFLHAQLAFELSEDVTVQLAIKVLSKRLVRMHHFRHFESTKASRFCSFPERLMFSPQFYFVKLPLRG